MFSFLLPVTLALGLLQPLTAQPGAESGQKQAYLGVTLNPGKDNQGVVIREVTPDSPAAKAGLKNGDEVLKLNGQTTRDVGDFIDSVSSHRAGAKISVTIRRDGKEQTINATLGERPQQDIRPAGGGGVPQAQRAVLGVQVEPLNADDKKRLATKAENGVVVMDVMPDTAAAKAGLQRNDVITAIDKTTVKTPMDLSDAVHKAGVGKQVTIHVMRGKEEKDLKATLQEEPRQLFPFGGPGGRLPPFEFNQFPDRSDRLMELQRRIDTLEKRLNELEKKLPPNGK